LALAVIMAAAGCGRPSGGPVEITYWTGWSSNELDSQQSLIDQFNHEHPNIRVRLVGQYGNSGYQKVRIAFAGNATPDVMSTVWADELASYAQRDVLEPLDAYMRASGRDLDKEYVPSLRSTLRVDGKVYALAVTTNSQFIVYNRDLLDAARQVPPKTANELRDVSRACTVIRPDGGFVRYGYLPSELRTWAYVFGGEWFDAKTNRVTANNPRNVEALRWMASFSQFIDPMRAQSFQAGFGSDYSASGPFFVGKYAMWQTGEWASKFLQQYAPDIRYGFFPLPGPKAGAPPSSYVNGSVFVIPKACPHKAEAWEFLNWITQPEQVRRFCAKIHNVPPLMSLGSAPEFQQPPLTKFAIAVSRSKEAYGPPGIAIWPEYSAEITRAEDAAIRGGQDPKTVLDDLQQRMQQTYEESQQELGR
jgi:multiple sugar transport system substrate-binding protein